MKYNINITISGYNFLAANYDDDSNSISIDLGLNKNDKLETLLERKNLINELRENIKLATDEIEQICLIQTLDKLLTTKDDILKKSYIAINFSEGIGELIKNNPVLLEKDIYINGEFDINRHDLDLLLTENNEEKPQLIIKEHKKSRREIRRRQLRFFL